MRHRGGAGTSPPVIYTSRNHVINIVVKVSILGFAASLEIFKAPDIIINVI